MLHFIHSDPIGLPGLIAFALGFAGFLTALLRARRRGRLAPQSATSARRGASIVWIIVQGIGIGIAGLGPLNVTLDPLSATALAEGVIVAALMAGMVLLFDLSSRAMGRNWALVARTREDGNLVQSGPFAGRAHRHDIRILRPAR